MKRYAFILPVLLVSFLTVATRSHAAPAVPPDSFVGVCSAIVYDLDNDAILFEQNVDQRIPPASLTKVLSMFLAMDFIKAGHARLDPQVQISKDAANAGGSSKALRAGETVPVERLLLGMAVSSGNDAIHAIAELVGGSVPAFVKMMNARARELGMRDSNFVNPHGLPAEGQYTTARDMLAVARAYLKAHPNALEMHNQRTLTHGNYTTWNKNPLLGQYEGADGLKTGWIRASGYNLIFTASKGGKRLLAVILGAPDIFARGGEACRLLDAGFMVCDNGAVSVTAALDNIPFDAKRVDPLKTGREFGLLKKRAVSARLAAARKARPRSSGLRCSSLPMPKSVRGKVGSTPARAAAQSGNGASKRKSHAARHNSRANRS